MNKIHTSFTRATTRASRSVRRAAMVAPLMALMFGAMLPQAHAHRGWLLPSSTVLSGTEPWVTVDAAVSNDLFYFEHAPMRLDGLTVTGPGAKALDAENKSTGRYRSTFDVKLEQAGTYRIAVVGNNLFASYKLNGENKRWRGKAEDFSKEIPAGAENVNVTRNMSRVETFVTVGKPDTSALAPTGQGIELVPVTHPNDLFQGEQATFRLLVDGEPAAGLKVSVVQGGKRYQDRLTEFDVVTDAKGQFNVTWPQPGMYWLNASYPQRVEGAPPPTGGTLEKPLRRAGYALTVEVLPQ